MKITVKADEHNFSLRIPNALVLNRMTGSLVCSRLEKNEITLTTQQLRTLLKALRIYRKTHKDWVFVEVTGSNGEYVQIKL